MGSIKTKNIVFVTGAFVNSSSWDDWQSYFRAKGYTTTAPPWPFKNGTSDELRKKQPNDTDLAALTLTEVNRQLCKGGKKLSRKTDRHWAFIRRTHDTNYC